MSTLIKNTLIIEEHSLQSAAIGIALQSTKTIENYECTNSLTAAKKHLKMKCYCVVIIDTLMKDSVDSSTGVLRYIQKNFPDTFIIALNDEKDFVMAGNIVLNEKTSIISKNESPEVIQNAINRMKQGKNYVSPVFRTRQSLRLKPSLPGYFLFNEFDLTKKEAEIINLIYSGYNNKLLSDCLGIVMSTLKKHLQNIYKKMKVNNKNELIRMVFQYQQAS
jgi:DNA-binding NarL/FixJ family response regulator